MNDEKLLRYTELHEWRSCARSIYAVQRWCASTNQGGLNQAEIAISRTNYYWWLAAPGEFWCEHPEIVRLLIEKGAPLESENNFGQTPLDFAKKSSTSSMAKEFTDILIEAGVKTK
jgi:hypothetical protein